MAALVGHRRGSTDRRDPVAASTPHASKMFTAVAVLHGSTRPQGNRLVLAVCDLSGPRLAAGAVEEDRRHPGGVEDVEAVNSGCVVDTISVAVHRTSEAVAADAVALEDQVVSRMADSGGRPSAMAKAARSHRDSAVSTDLMSEAEAVEDEVAEAAGRTGAAVAAVEAAVSMALKDLVAAAGVVVVAVEALATGVQVGRRLTEGAALVGRNHSAAAGWRRAPPYLNSWPEQRTRAARRIADRTARATISMVRGL